jgi:SOS-response transcriptional repressor LexA
MDQTYGTTEKIIDFIRVYYIKNLKFPTYQEIANGVNLKSKATVNVHMLKIEKRGKVEFHGQQYRFNRDWMLGMYRDILESEAPKCT